MLILWKSLKRYICLRQYPNVSNECIHYYKAGRILQYDVPNSIIRINLCVWCILCLMHYNWLFCRIKFAYCCASWLSWQSFWWGRRTLEIVKRKIRIIIIILNLARNNWKWIIIIWWWVWSWIKFKRRKCWRKG